MSFFFSPSDAVAQSLVIAKSFEAVTASAGISVGDSITRRQYTDNTGTINTTTFFNETTGLAVTTAPAAANLVELLDNAVDVQERNIANRIPQTHDLNLGTSAGVVLTKTTGTIASLFVTNANGATVGHWVGVTAGSAAPVSGTTAIFAAVWIPGAANSQALLDATYLNSFPATTGYNIVRSSNPGTYTVLGAALANNQTVRVTSVAN